MDKIPLKEVPERVVDKERGITYIRGKFLGKGGFARCYELTNANSNEIFAGKIVSKSLLVKPYQREKVMVCCSFCVALGSENANCRCHKRLKFIGA